MALDLNATPDEEGDEGPDLNSHLQMNKIGVSMIPWKQLVQAK